MALFACKVGGSQGVSINNLTAVSSGNSFTGVKNKYYIICGSGNANDRVSSVTNCNILSNAPVITQGSTGCALVKCTANGSCTISHTFSYIRVFVVN